MPVSRLLGVVALTYGGVRLGLVSFYPPRRHRLAESAAALVRELAANCRPRPYVCALDRHALEYPDEVSAVVWQDQAADYRRVARIMAEDGVDAVVLDYADGVYGGPGGAHALELTNELRRHGLAYLIRMNSPAPTSGEAAAVMATLAGSASAIAVPDDRLAASVMRCGLATADRIVASAPVALLARLAADGPGPLQIGVPLGSVPRDLTQTPGEHLSIPDAARLAAVATTLAAVAESSPAGISGPPGVLDGGLRALARVWGAAAMPVLAAAAAAPPLGGAGWLVRGLGALASSGFGVRDQAARALAGQRPDALTRWSLDDAALAALGLQADPASPLLRPALARLSAARRAADRGPGWPWFTDRVTGVAARLPHALFAGGHATGDPALVESGLAALNWYLRRAGLGPPAGRLILNPPAAGEGAEEATAVVEALAAAYTITGEPRYGRLAQRAFGWFGGENRYAQPAYDPDLGRCRERLGPVLPRYPLRATLAYLGAATALAAAGLARLEPADQPGCAVAPAATGP